VTPNSLVKFVDVSEKPAASSEALNKLETVRFSNASLNFNPTALFHVPEGIILHSRSSENLKSQSVLFDLGRWHCVHVGLFAKLFIFKPK
jgi:hypothetical protein